MIRIRSCRYAALVRRNPLTRNSWLLMACFLLVCSAALVVPASAQHFKQVTATTFLQVAAGRNEVFGVGTSNQIYRYNPGTKTFVQIPGSLAQVAVGGGTVSQKDEVWGVGTSGQIYHFNYGTKTFNQVTGSLDQIVVGEGVFDNCHPYEVWGLNAVQSIFRYNYCTRVFDQIAGSLTHIATGGGTLWGLNGSAEIFYFDLDLHGFVQVAGSLQQIAVGTNDVWGLDGSGNLYHFEVSSGGFVAYSLGLPLALIAAGGDGSWATDTIGPDNFLLLPSDAATGATNYKGFITFAQIAVGYGTGFWGVDSLNHAFTFVRP